MALVRYKPAWHQQGKMTMSGDMHLVLLDVANSVLGPELRVEWDEKYLNLEINNFEFWRRACELWKQAGWISKRVAFAANCRTEAERTRALSQPLQQNPAPTMAVPRAATDNRSSSRER